MNTVTLGRTGIAVPQNGFGALSIQRIPKADVVRLLRRCASRCSYGLDTPALLRANLANYRRVFAGDVKA
jgi:hypothetical protein